jgi:glycosyltransferase involved in cell wall biosynthesis
LTAADTGAHGHCGGRKKILLISGFRIFPMNTGGHVRTGGIAGSLARLGHEVLIYSLAGRQRDYAFFGSQRRSHHLEALAPTLSEETNLGLGYGLLQTLGRRLDRPRVWQYWLLARGWIPKRLQTALQDADFVVSDMPWCPVIPGPWAAKPWFLISHNLEHRLLEQAHGRHRRFAGWMRQVERDAPSRYRDILTCSEEDRSFFRQHDTGGRLALPIVRCGVDPAAYAVPPGTRERLRAQLDLTDSDRVLVFSASGFAPNVEALETLRAFCRAEQEFLARERLRILVVGSVVSAPYREGALLASGRVPEISPYLAAADAGLNPIVRGSGANVKLFEYLAARLPVISTAFGVRGTELQPERDFLPFEPLLLKDALQRFVRDRSPEQWRAHAEDVWRRHRATCDIQELVKAAIEQLPAFGPKTDSAPRPVRATG